MFVIIAGEMRDVDYCSVYGPFETEGDAEKAAEVMVANGTIEDEPDEGFEWRVEEVKAPVP